MYSRKALEEARQKQSEGEVQRSLTLADIPVDAPQDCDGVGFYDAELKRFIAPDLWFRRNGRVERIG
jgi:hypothetical protein